MSTSSEDVLLMVSEVRHKKTDGTIYLMSERIAWMPNGKDTFTISHKYSDIKMQKISPESKPKIQLQVVLNNNEATTFHFVHADGLERQLKDRNDIKEMLAHLLPKFKQKISKDLQEKNQILINNPELYQLYKDLVMSKVLNADEFWKQIVPVRFPSLGDIIKTKDQQAINEQDNNNFLSRAIKKNIQQNIGISPAFLADIKPTHDGCNGIQYNITTDIIEAIFRTYPAVRRKHFDYVPHKLSDSEFWTRFFQSHYFHRDRVLTGVSSNKNDLFADCDKSDELDLKNAAKNKIIDTFINLEELNDTDYLHRLPADDKHQQKKDAQQQQDKKEEVKKKRERDRDIQIGPVMSANQALIKRFNHHSIMVMEASTTPLNQNKDAATVTKNDSLNSKNHNDSTREDQLIKIKKRKLEEKTEYEDLDENCLTDSYSWFVNDSKELNLMEKSRYVNSVGVSSNPNERAERISIASLYQLNQYQSYLISHLKDVNSKCLLSPDAITALSELSPGGSLVKSTQIVNLKETVSAEIQKELKEIYFATNELLRHFWACFPVTSERLEEKLIKMKETLEKYKFTRIQNLHEKLQTDHQNQEVCQLSIFKFIILFLSLI